MNYFGMNYFLLNKAEKDDEINQIHLDYENNLISKESRFPSALKSMVFNKDLYDISMIAFGSLNFKIELQDDCLKIQIPHTVELDNSSISEFLLFNLSLSSKAKINIIQYNNGKPENITFNILQHLLEDQTTFCLKNIGWDSLENNEIQLNLNFFNKLSNQFIEVNIDFYNQDILSAKLRIPNYSAQDYMYLEESGENDVRGYNRTKKILDTINEHFTDKQYILI